MHEGDILVVDDEPDLCDLLRFMLEASGYTVRTALNGRLGLESFRTQPPDLVITDIFMPEMDGLELMAEMRKITDDVKIVVITGAPVAGLEPHRLAERFGVIKTIWKPFGVAEVLAAVREALAPPAA